ASPNVCRQTGQRPGGRKRFRTGTDPTAAENVGIAVRLPRVRPAALPGLHKHGPSPKSSPGKRSAPGTDPTAVENVGIAVRLPGCGLRPYPGYTSIAPSPKSSPGKRSAPG